MASITPMAPSDERSRPANPKVFSAPLHAKRLLYLGLIFFFALRSWSANGDGLSLLRKMQAALGGVDRLAGVHDLEWRVIAKTWDATGVAGGDVSRRIRWRQPGFYRKDQQGSYGTVIEFFDGTGGWEILPARGFTKLSGNELEIVRSEAIGFMLNLWLADRNPDFEVRSGGTGVIRISSRQYPTASLGAIAVDTKSGLPAQAFAVPLSGAPIANYQRIRQRTESSSGRRSMAFDGLKG